MVVPLTFNFSKKNSKKLWGQFFYTRFSRSWWYPPPKYYKTTMDLWEATLYRKISLVVIEILLYRQSSCYFYMKRTKVPQKNSDVIKIRDEERRSGKETPLKKMDNPSFWWRHIEHPNKFFCVFKDGCRALQKKVITHHAKDNSVLWSKEKWDTSLMEN